MSPRRLTTAAVIFAALAAFAPGHASEPGDEVLSVTGAGRIAVSLDGRGYFREIESGGLRLGLRWPGTDGTEFLGGGGLLMRFVIGEEEGSVLLGPGDFERWLPGTGIVEAEEGCRGGKRYPAGGSDDDGDGISDEDPLDGRDNDHDGEIDEDFAAVGDGMFVTSSLAPRYGVSVTRTHHVWNYGHVRDFIGFTTTIEYLPPEGFDDVLREFELIQYIDFNVGERDDAGRGRDDRAFLVQTAPEEDGETEAAVAAVSGKDGDGPLAAVVLFDASGPGTPLAAEAMVRRRLRHVDSLWTGEDGSCTVLGDEPELLDIENAEILQGKGGRNVILAGAVKGDIVLEHRFGPAVDLYPGDRIGIEWAIVFGKDLAALARNISRARETWEGMSRPDGGVVRWVVPARRAVRIEAKAALAPVWVQEEKCAAVSVDLPTAEGEEIEWLRVAGEQTDDFETVGGRLVIAIEEVTAATKPFAIEGQLTDGTIFTSHIGEEELLRYTGEDDLQPGRLPEDSITLFPNPFAQALTIDVLVHEPSRYVKSGAAVPQTGPSSVRVYDVKGRLVRTILTDEVLHPGGHTLGWDGVDEAGMPVAAGVYYCRLQIGERSLTRRVILLR